VLVNAPSDWKPKRSGAYITPKLVELETLLHDNDTVVLFTSVTLRTDVAGYVVAIPVEDGSELPPAPLATSQ